MSPRGIPTAAPRMGRLLPVAGRAGLMLGGVLVALVFLAAGVSLVWTPHDPTVIVVTARFQPPSAEHWLGTDQLGRDVASMLMVGARHSVTVALLAVGIGGSIGTALGLAASAIGGWVEIKADPKASPNDIYRKFERWLRAENVTAEGAKVLSAQIAMRFRHDGPGRAPTLRFSVSAPNSSNLKSKPDEQRAVGERCLRRWGVTDDQ